VKELSPEKRALLAGVLSLLVIVAWSYFFAPKPKPQPPATSPAATQPAPQPGTQPGPPAPAQVKAAPPASRQAKAAAEEKTIVVENGLYRVELSNRGAVVRSWVLKKYTDDNKPPKPLDLVHAETAPKFGWPFSLALDDSALEQQINAALFEVTPSSGPLDAPAEVRFEWSDARTSVSKRLKFAPGSYVVHIETSVTVDGQPRAHNLAWRGGFGDPTVYLAAEQVQAFFSAVAKFTAVPNKELGVPDQPAQRQRRASNADFGGIQDLYFAAAFVPEKPGTLTLTDWRLERDVVIEGKPAKQPLAEVAVGSSEAAGPLALRVFVGPKDLDILKAQNPPLGQLVDFGWMEFIAAPLFYFLRWIYGYVPNYGWAIIILTVAINMVLFPLKLKSWRSMQKMQRVAHEVKSIQERYKKYGMRDPRKQQMNQEIMELYKRHGINPVGGCLPMLLQMPIWFGLYRMLTVTIELRHAPWIWWIRDLSVKDPYYILPVLMGLTMYAMQKMTPMTATDPAQQKMLTFMPLMFGGMFVIFPVSSGLVLYILSSNLVGIAQQWYLNKYAPAELKPGHGKKKPQNT